MASDRVAGLKRAVPGIFAFALFGIAGCGREILSVGQRFDTNQTGMLVRGTSSRADVIKVFGRPSLSLNAGRNNEALVYSYSKGTTEDYEIGLLLVALDENGIVKDYYSGLQATKSEKEKSKTSASKSKMSDEAARLINELMAANEPYKRISAVVMSMDHLDPASKGFLQGRIETQLDTETDSAVRAVYLWAMGELTSDQRYANSLVELLANDATVQSSLQRKNVIAFAGVLDAVSTLANSGSESAMRLVLGRMSVLEHRDTYSEAARKLVEKQFDKSLAIIGALPDADLTSELETVRLKRDIDDVRYLKLQYFASTNDAALGPAAKRVLHSLPN